MSLLTSAPISALAVELLRRQAVLVNTVSKVPGNEYAGPSGGTATIRVPRPRVASEQVTPGSTITFTDIDEVPVDVTLRHLYDACRVTDEDLSLSLQNFGRQVLLPQVASVAEAAEDTLASAMNALTADTSIAFGTAPDPAADEQTILAVRERMSEDGIPAGDRWMAVSPAIATRILSIDKVVKVDERGQRSALEDAIIGRLYGINFVESAALDADTACAYHSSGFGFGNRPPVAPGGGADSTSASEGGVSLRAVVAFDATRLASASVVSVFAGASVVPEDTAGTTIKRAIKIETTGS